MLSIIASIAFADVAGTVPIGADRPIADWAGIPASANVWNPSDPAIGRDAGVAKQYLASVAKDLRGSRAPVSNPDNIKNLNSAFAECLAKFLQAYKKQYGEQPIVVSAFRCGPRSDPKINCNRNDNANAGGATNSNHQIGVAADLSGNLDRIRGFERANPQFGIVDIMNQVNDPPHFQAANRSSPSCQGVDSVPVKEGSGTQSAPFSGAVNSMLGQQQQQQSYNPAASQALPASQQPSFASSPVTTGSTGSTGSTVTGSSVPTSGGTTGTSIPTTGTSVGTSLGGDFGNGTTSTSTNATSTGPSTWDQLLSMANGGDQNTNTNTNDNQNATATPVDLNNNLDNSTGLTSQSASDTSTIVVPPGPGNTATLQSAQTFVSQDMTNQPNVAPQPSTFGSSVLGGILQKLKLMLLNILDQLKPLMVPFYNSGNAAQGPPSME